MSGQMTRVNSFQFEMSQSVTSSIGVTFTQGNTVEVSFLTRGSVGNSAFTSQFVDLYYATDSRTAPTWQRINSNYPKQFYSPNLPADAYATKSFVAGLDTDAVALKMIITGSVNSTASYTSTTNTGGGSPSVNVKYDSLTLKVHTPHSELTQDGLLVWNSPNKYIRADKDGIDIKGGAVEVETIVVDDLQVYGDVTAFGQMVTTNLEPFTETPSDIGTTASPGTVSEVKYAKGDHTHDLPFSTLNAVAQEGEFTNISGSSTSTGSFGAGYINNKLGIGTTNPSAQLQVALTANVANVLVGGGIANLHLGQTGGSSESIIGHNLKAAGSDGNFDVAVSHNYFGYRGIVFDYGGTDEGIKFHSYYGNVTAGDALSNERMRITNDGKVGIGTTAPDSALEVAGTGAGTTLTVTGVATNSGDDIGFINFANDIVVSGEVEAYVGAVSNSGGRRRGELVFGTGDASSSEKMRIDYQGNVGIGTTSPGYKLEIYDASATVRAGIHSNGGHAYLDIDAPTGFGSFVDYHRNGSRLFHTGLSDTADNYEIRDTSNNRLLVIESTGNVGIGTGSPDNHKLHIKSDTGLFLERDAGTYGLEVYADAAGSYLKASANDLQFWTNSTPSEKMRITQAGDVGVGTTNPSEKLHIATGSILVEPIAYASNQDKYVIKIQTYNSNQWDGRMGLKVRSDSNGVPFLSFRENNNNDVLVMKGTNVGIGESDPTQSLEIVSAEGDGILVNRNSTATSSPVEIGFRHTTSAGTATTGMRSYRTDEVTNYDQELRFFTRDGDTGEGEHLTIKHDGKIGIGTTNPTELLTVSGGNAWIKPTGPGSSSKLYLSSNETTDNTIMFIEGQDGAGGEEHNTGDNMNFQINRWSANYRFRMAGASASYHDIFKVRGIDSSTTPAYANLTLYHTSSVGNEARFYVRTDGDAYFTNAGNVGIGTSTPDYKLDVEGVMRVTNGAYINGSIGTYTGADGNTHNLGLHVENDISASGFVGEYFEITSSILITSESTQFGNDDSDIHIFTGSIEVTNGMTGSLTGEVNNITALTIANNVDVGDYKITSKALEASDLTSGRITFASTNGLLTDDSDLTFSSNTLTATKIGAFEAAGAINFSDEVMTLVNIDSGDIATAVVINKSPVITLGGDLSGNATLSNLASTTLTATIVANSVQDSMLNDDVATGLAGDGMTAANGVMNVIAGTGIDVTANSIALDISDIIANESANRILTSNGDATLTAQSNLEFNGSLLTLTGNLSQTTTGQSIYNSFTSGYIGGAGWSINHTSNGSNLEIDNITVRNTLQTHIFQKDVVKAVNGYLYISDSGVIASASIGDSKITFNSASATFANNDLLWFKDADPTSGDINSVYFRINGAPTPTGNDSMGNASYTYNVDEVTGSLSDLVVGGTAVRVSGGSLLLDASSTNSPFMDVIVDNDTKVRTGNLAGITSANTNFGSSGTLSGFGFYASGSAYLEGGINSSEGSIGGWTLDTNTIYNSNVTMSNTNGGYISLNNGGILLSGSGEGYVANQSMSWDSSGNLQITGSLQLTNGEASASIASLTVSANSFSTQIGNLETTSSTLTQASNSFALDISNATSSIASLVLTDSSFSTQIGNLETTSSTLTQASNSFSLSVNSLTSGTSSYLTAVNINQQGVQISGSSLEFSGSTFVFGNTNEQYISGSGGDIEISASNFHLKNGNITASNVDLSGKITATTGDIAGWDISGTTISKNGIVLESNPSYPKITIAGTDSAGITANEMLSFKKTSYLGQPTAFIESTNAIVDIVRDYHPQTCFLGGTHISINDTGYKEVQDIIESDNVLSYDTNSKEFVTSKVLSNFSRENDGYYVINSNIKVTEEHPFYVNDEWVKVKDLKVGDLLFDKDSNNVTINSIEYVDEVVTVYNFEVDNTHTYFAEDVLVHNKDVSENPTTGHAFYGIKGEMQLDGYTMTVSTPGPQGNIHIGAGVYALSTGGNTGDVIHAGLFASASGAGTNYAGMFHGDVSVTGSVNIDGNINTSAIIATTISTTGVNPAIDFSQIDVSTNIASKAAGICTITDMHTIHTDRLTIDGDGNYSGITLNGVTDISNIGFDNTVLVLITGEVYKQEIDSRVWGTTLLDNSDVIDISSGTNLVAGTNITLAGDTLNVDDVFLKNNANDTTTGTITSAGLTTSGVIKIGGEVQLEKATDRVGLMKITDISSSPDYAGIQAIGNGGTKWSFMGSSYGGIYDDTNNKWSVLVRPKAEVELHYNGVQKLETTSTGATVTGILNATEELSTGNTNHAIRNFGTITIAPVAGDHQHCTTTEFIAHLCSIGMITSNGTGGGSGTNGPPEQWSTAKCSWSYASNNDISDGPNDEDIELAGCWIEVMNSSTSYHIRITAPYADNSSDSSRETYIYNRQSGAADWWTYDQYSTFTGAHPTKILNNDTGSLVPGMVLKSTGEVFHTDSGVSNAWVFTTPTTTSKDKAVVGVYKASKTFLQYDDTHQYNAVGEGRILVTDTNGNIETGDYICSSTRIGHGEKQDDDLLHNYTVAKATQPYNFASASVDSDLGYKSVLIACTYHCG